MSITSENIEIKQLEAVDHALQNPDMYFGDIGIKQINGYGYDVEDNVIYKNKSTISFVLLKMVDELLMNVTDNALRSQRSKTPMTFMNVSINKNTHRITICNDGLSIPLKKMNGKYYPEIAFTNLFTSSNFNDNRTGAGKNGVGASITNVMSIKFIIDIVCSGKRYSQTITNNCKQIDPPVITKTKVDDYVCISFIPDMVRICNISSYNESVKNEVFDGTLPFIMKRIFDVNMLLQYYNVTSYFNNEELPETTLLDYANMLYGNIDFMRFTNSNYYEILIGLSDKNVKIKDTSFVNNIAVSSGIHLSNIYKQITEKAIEVIKCDKKNAENIKKTIKSKLVIVMRCNVTNPMFEGQGKNKLQHCDNMINLLLSNSSIEKLFKEIDFETIVNGQQIEELNKKIKTKRNQKLIIEKLTDADMAGTTKSNKCTLFLCEGDSAAKLAKDGIAKLGHEYFGVYPLGGKPINVRDISYSKISENKTIINLIKILGLPIRNKNKINKDSSNEWINKLRYHKIVMLKDADTDGAHIMGLVINILQQLYPELLQIEGFFNEFITPMIKVIIPIKLLNKVDITASDLTKAGTIIMTKHNCIYPFYNTNDYNKFIQKYKQFASCDVSYVKGLGGHNTSETIKYFENYINNVIALHMDNNAENMLDVAFNKKLANKRKDMLFARTEECSLPRYVGVPLKCSDFINNDWLNYSYDACLRALPSVVDGLKPSQRKVLYVLLNNFKSGKSNTEENITHFKKVFQVTGEVAQKGYYHHGDNSLNETIIKMAQDYCGSNNLPLLAYNGSFGSRDMNGDDAGAPRYISTTIHEVARYIFPKEDDILLTLSIEDNVKVEPIYYVPIIPMLLINGATGIGTGFSTKIMKHNALQIIEAVKNKLQNNKYELYPKYNYYKGNIEKLKNKYIIHGKYNIVNKMVGLICNVIVNVTEIPFDVSKQDFIKQLQSLYVNGIIKDYKENKSDSINDFNFVIIYPDNISVERKQIEKDLLLTSSISTANMNAFNSKGCLTKYETTKDIFIEWYNTRLNLYKTRKQYIINEYRKNINILRNKCNFIEKIVSSEIDIGKNTKDELEEKLMDCNFDMIDNSYDYLINIPVYMLTLSEYNKLTDKRDKLIKEYEKYKSKTIETIWNEELNKLQEYIVNNYDYNNW